MIKNYLLAPGPTPVPPRVLQAMAAPLMHHRTPQFSRIFAECAAGLKRLFQTGQEVLILAASGTGAMEAAVTNVLSPGERVLTVNAGKFGARWGKICTSYGVEATEITVEWGQPVRVEDVRRQLDAHRDIRAVFVQATETSTTVLHPVEELAELTRDRDVLLVVDGITAVGVLDLPMDRLGIDILLTGSQKALMLPPGLAFIALSERAWERTKQARLPRFYFDLNRERDSQANRTSAWTPAISLIVGLRESLAMMEEEGFEQMYARHERLARATRAAGRALGLGLLAAAAPSPAATALCLPRGVDGAELVAYLRDRMGVVFAGGQDHLKGKIVRMAHLGYMSALDVVTGVGALEMALKQLGYGVDFGRGVAAAEAILDAGVPG